MKYLFLIFILFLLINCKSYRNSVTGNWKLMSVVNSDDSYAMRSSLIPQKVESNNPSVAGYHIQIFDKQELRGQPVLRE